MYREQALGFVEEGLIATLDRYNGTDSTDIAITEAWDFVQTTVSCFYQYNYDSAMWYL